MIKYKVSLTKSEHEELIGIISKGVHALHSTESKAYMVSARYYSSIRDYKQMFGDWGMSLQHGASASTLRFPSAPSIWKFQH